MATFTGLTQASQFYRAVTDSWLEGDFTKKGGMSSPTPGVAMCNAL